MFGDCKGKPDPHKVIEKICPNCGSIIEMFPVDAKMACEKCGFVAYNDTMSCVRWCSSARSCVGEEMYAAVQEAIKREEMYAATQEAIKREEMYAAVQEAIKREEMYAAVQEAIKREEELSASGKSDNSKNG